MRCESKRLNYLKESAIIISANGMAENGRILHHLKNNIEEPENTILFVSFQAENTLGRRLTGGRAAREDPGRGVRRAGEGRQHRGLLSARGPGGAARLGAAARPGAAEERLPGARRAGSARRRWPTSCGWKAWQVCSRRSEGIRPSFEFGRRFVVRAGTADRTPRDVGLRKSSGCRSGDSGASAKS